MQEGAGGAVERALAALLWAGPLPPASPMSPARHAGGFIDAHWGGGCLQAWPDREESGGRPAPKPRTPALPCRFRPPPCRFSTSPSSPLQIPDPTTFDGAFFAVHNKQASRMDPQLRKLLEVTAEAWVDAGIDARALRGSDRVGVYCGSGGSEIMTKWLAHKPDITGEWLVCCV